MFKRIFDSHCHPQFPQYDKDRKEMLARTLKKGVFMVCVGTDLETSRQGIELAQQYEGMWASVGLHPNDNLSEKFEPTIYEELLEKQKVVAFGEIGLDYYRTKKPEAQQIQKERFIQQLELAKKVQKPLILHCRAAYKDMIEILKNGYIANGGVVHSFTGTPQEGRQFLDLGLYLGFNGIVTFARQYDQVVQETPVNRILLETDAPYLTPEPYRGQRNEPAYVVEVAKKLAELKSLKYETLIQQTTENCLKLFKIIGKDY